MAKSANFKVKSAKKAAPKVEINEGTYTAEIGGKAGGGAGWRSSGVQAPADPISAIYDTPPKNAGKMAISDLSGQYTKPIPVPKKARPTAK